MAGVLWGGGWVSKTPQAPQPWSTLEVPHQGPTGQSFSQGSLWDSKEQKEELRGHQVRGQSAGPPPWVPLGVFVFYLLEAPFCSLEGWGSLV